MKLLTYCSKVIGCLLIMSSSLLVSGQTVLTSYSIGGPGASVSGASSTLNAYMSGYSTETSGNFSTTLNAGFYSTANTIQQIVLSIEDRFVGEIKLLYNRQNKQVLLTNPQGHRIEGFEIIDVTGKSTSARTEYNGFSDFQISVYTDNLNTGIYLLSFLVNDQRVSRRFFVHN